MDAKLDPLTGNGWMKITNVGQFNGGNSNEYELKAYGLVARLGVATVGPIITGMLPNKGDILRAHIQLEVCFRRDW